MEMKPGYKRTEIGIIPLNWDLVSVGTVASFTSGSGISVASLRVESSDTPVPVFGGNGIAGFTDRPLVGEPTVVVGRVGQKCGEVYLTSGPAWITDNALYPRTKHREFDVRFLALALNGAGLNDVKNRNDLPLVTQAILHAVRIAWPPDIKEQQAIATALSDVDALLGVLDQLIAKKRDLKQAAMQQLLTGQTRLPGFSGEWEVTRLGDVVEILKGQLITEKDATPGNIPVIAGGKKPSYFHNKPNRTGKTITVSGSGASAGYVAFHETAIFASDCSTISESQDYAIEFIYFLLQLRQDDIYKAQTGGAQPHIHPSDLRPIKVRVPKVSEQTAIADILSDMNAEIVALEQRRDKTRALKQAMMQELLTGKTRLVSPRGSHA
jgi:type I restriction enzyme S subunit